MRRKDYIPQAGFSGHLLVASPTMDDARFSHSVVLVCDHTSEGSFGLIVNKILMNSYSPLLGDFSIDRSVVDLPVYYGGPVRPDYGYVIYSPYDGRYQSILVKEGLAVTASREILQDIAAGRGPEQYVFALGFAGWGSDQLEEELMEDIWIVAPLDPDVIFRVPVEERWKRAAGLIGVDFSRYTDKTGHA